ncbi:MAG: hypothetical protein ACI4SR_01080, partial [Faecalibacillus sp.]
MDYEEYEKSCEAIRQQNDELLNIFVDDLKGLSPKTINNHLRNVDFYINDYLLYGDLLTFDQGIEVIDDFFDNFFIRKCMWSTPSTIKSTAASLKKFYKSMADHQKINKED